MIRQLHYLGLLLPLFTTSSWAAEQNSSVHIAPPEATLQCMARRRILSVVSGLIRCSTLTTTSVFPRLMSPLNTVPAPRHTHPAGQRLIVTSGVGLTQQEGKPVQVIRAGDVISCPADVKHWHGAAPVVR